MPTPPVSVQPLPYWATPASDFAAAGGRHTLAPARLRADDRLLALAVLLALPPDTDLGPSAASTLAGGRLGRVYRMMTTGEPGRVPELAAAVTFRPAVKHGMRQWSASTVPAGALAAYVSARSPAGMLARAGAAWAAYAGIHPAARVPPPLRLPVWLVERALAPTPFG